MGLAAVVTCDCPLNHRGSCDFIMNLIRYQQCFACVCVCVTKHCTNAMLCIEAIF